MHKYMYIHIYYAHVFTVSLDDLGANACSCIHLCMYMWLKLFQQMYVIAHIIACVYRCVHTF